MNCSVFGSLRSIFRARVFGGALACTLCQVLHFPVTIDIDDATDISSMVTVR